MDKEKFRRIFAIILLLENKLKDKDLGVPLQSVYDEIKRQGLYETSESIQKVIKKLEQEQKIRIENWNIVEVRK